MSLFDTVNVDVLSATMQTKQLGEGMLTYRLTEERRLVASCGAEIASATSPIHSLEKRKEEALATKGEP